MKKSNFFSSRQQWRRTVSRPIREKPSDTVAISTQQDYGTDGTSPIFSNVDEVMRSSSEPSSICDEPIDEKVNATGIDEITFGFDSNLSGVNYTTAVSFNPVTQACAVPSRKDYGPQIKELYWHQEDYDIFKQDALGEIRMYLRLTGTSAKEAITTLYQPEFDSNALVTSILYRSHLLPMSFMSPSQLNVSSDAYSFNDEDDDAVNSDLDEDIEGTAVMRHIDSLSSFHESGFITDSESSVASSSFIDDLSSSPCSQVGMDIDQYCCSGGEGNGRNSLGSSNNNSYSSESKPVSLSATSGPSSLGLEYPRVASGGVWIDCDYDSDSIVSDTADYAM